MTNEEKARELSIKWGVENCDCGDNSRYECHDAALEMAEWKDDIIRERLDFEIEKANTYYDNNKNVQEMYKHIGAVIALSDILGIKFPYDKLHMGFATMD